MRTIIGGLLILFGFILNIWANVLHFKAEAELLAKRPELGEHLYFFPRVRILTVTGFSNSGCWL
jgi:hypothetical protein